MTKHLFVSPAVIENAKTKDNNNNNESTEIHVSAIPALLPGSQWGTMHLISPTEDAAFIHMTGVNRLHRPWKKINGRMRGEKKKEIWINESRYLPTDVMQLKSGELWSISVGPLQPSVTF